MVLVDAAGFVCTVRGVRLVVGGIAVVIYTAGFV